MSQENVELVRKLHTAFSRGDLEGVLSCWHPEAEYSSAIHQAVEGEAGAFRGHDGLRRWFRELQDLYSDLNTELFEVRDLADQVLVVFVIRGKARTSGLEDENTLAQVVTVGQGKIIKARDYRSRAEALEAVGLSE